MAKHQDLDAEKAHVPGFFQDTDPGAIGPGKLWIDTSGGSGNWEMKLRNATDDGWEAISGGSGFTDHGVLLGLGDDDHPQYHNDARGDARYSLLGHDHTVSEVTDFDPGDYLPLVGGTLTGDLTVNADVYINAATTVYGNRYESNGDNDVQFWRQTVNLMNLEADKVNIFEDLRVDDPKTAYFPRVEMRGNVEFNDEQQGIAFWDNDSAWILAFYIDYAEPEIRIGGNFAVGLGGHPIVRADTQIFRIGDFSGGLGGFAALEMWNQDGMSGVPVIQLTSDNPGDPLEVGFGDFSLQLTGSETRPAYNGGDLALLSDVPVGGTYDPEAIPRMQIGSGQAHVSVVNGLAYDVFPLPVIGGTPYFRVCARDFIRFIRGGATTLNYKVEIISWFDNGGGTPSMVYSSDPTSPLDLATDLDVNVNQTHIFRIWIQDGNTGDQTYVETYALLQDNQGIIPPPGP
jgi:hypothetical protein